MKIPRYQSAGRLPTVRVPSELAESPGRALQQVGAAVSETVERWQKEREHEDMTKAQLELGNWATQEIDRINSLKGYAAEGSAKKFSDEYRRKASEIISRNPSERVKSAFNQWAESERQSSWANIARYERSQQKAASLATYELRNQQILSGVSRGGDINKAMAAINENAAFGVSAGNVLPAQAELNRQIFTDKAKEASFNYAYSIDPEQAIDNINAYDLPETFKAAKREQFSDDIYNDLVKRNRMADISEKNRLERESQMQTNIASQGFQLESEGALTAEWYANNQKSMAIADRIYFGRKTGVVPPSSESDNQAVVAELNSLAAKGKVKELQLSARTQYAYGNISTETYERYRSGKMTFDTGILKEGADAISKVFKPNPLNPREGAAQREYNALSDWKEFVRENPDMTEAQYRSKYNDIISSYQLISADSMAITLPKVPGIPVRKGVTLEMVNDAKRRLADDLRNNRITKTEAGQRALYIKSWEEISKAEELKSKQRLSNAGQ